MQYEWQIWPFTCKASVRPQGEMWRTQSAPLAPILVNASEVSVLTWIRLSGKTKNKTHKGLCNIHTECKNNNNNLHL